MPKRYVSKLTLPKKKDKKKSDLKKNAKIASEANMWLETAQKSQYGELRGMNNKLRKTFGGLARFRIKEGKIIGVTKQGIELVVDKGKIRKFEAADLERLKAGDLKLLTIEEVGKRKLFVRLSDI